MKKLIYCLLFILLFFVVGCSNESEEIKTKIIRPTYIGNTVYFYGTQDEEYAIDGLGKTSNLMYKNDEYIFSKEGEITFDVLNKNGKKVTTIKGTKKTKKEFSINLDESNINFINVDNNEITDIYVTSNSILNSHQFAINILEGRTLPLIITFDNVNINNKGEWDVIANFTTTSIDLIIKNNVYLTSGKSLNGEDASNNTGDRIFYTVIYTALGIKSVKPTKMLLSIGKNFLKGDSFIEAIYNYENTIINYEKAVIENLYCLLLGENGADGIDGLPTIVSGGNIHIDAQGRLVLIGGEGGDGGAGRTPLIGTTKGGNGGNSSYAIICDTLLLENKDNMKISSGLPGKGGIGGPSILGDEGTLGNEGKKVNNDIISNYLFKID